MPTNEEIRSYWDSRAAQEKDQPTATTNDICMRELEAITLIATLRQMHEERPLRVLDMGCGDGLTTLRVARSLPNANITGLDYAENMIKSAREHLAHSPDLHDRVTFSTGDVTGVSRGGSTYDVVITVRCLINLSSTDLQLLALEQVAACLPSGGHYLAIENFLEGQENLNAARQSMDLPPISIRWHNLYFTEGGFKEMAHGLFAQVEFRDFASSYYFTTRVIYSAMCQRQGLAIDYDHELHHIAVRLPSVGQFSPIRLVVLTKQ